MDFYYMELPSYISIIVCALVGLVLLFIKFSKFEVSITITNYLITFALPKAVDQPIPLLAPVISAIFLSFIAYLNVL